MAERRITPIIDNWCFRREDDVSSQFLPVSQFPTNIHLDLMHHGLIQDPFTGASEKAVQWVGEKVWIYRTTFLSPTVLSNEKAWLAFDGLDTFASVRLNGILILESDNMFVPERVDITSSLRKSDIEPNILELTFDSAWLRGKEDQSSHPSHRWGCWNGDPSRLAVRKAQYHYGWDWGPVLLTCGPWRPINLEIYCARISDLHSTTKLSNSFKEAEVTVTAQVENSATDVVFNLSLDQEVYSQTAEVVKGSAVAVFHLKNPQLWYPATYGAQPLYTIEATLRSDGKILDTAKQRIGLRKAEVIQRPLKDAPGTSFHFEINGIPIFCGGSNWIPADSFVPRLSTEQYRKWLQLAVDGNQVMVRVWAGGIYEQDAFYDICDELGLLVWQDFLFACGNYPAHPKFLASVKKEAIANVTRLRKHPSIVIWAGNNEDYQYMEAEKLEYDPSDKNPENWLKTNFPARFIYEKILLDITKKLIPDTFYHFGSPYGGKDTRDPTVGDIHQWNVWHGTQEKYQNFDRLGGRFVSEFGMQALPNIKTIDAFLPDGSRDSDRYVHSFTLDYHNKAVGHERRLAAYLVENIRYSVNPLEQYIHCTQIMQAECVSTAYRLWKRQWKGKGRELCAGVLVWQMNDCWPVTSWSTVDYYLRPKYAYFAIKRELAPITIGVKQPLQQATLDQPSAKVHKVEIWGTNLTLHNQSVQVRVKAWDIITGDLIYSQTLKGLIELPQNQTIEIAELEIPNSNKNPQDSLQTVVAAYLFDSEKQIARYISWPEPLKYLHLQKPQGLKIELATDRRQVNLSANLPVKGLAIFSECDGVKFDDNCVDLVPGETVSIGVRGLENSPDAQFTHQALNF
ncbi:hypothetical protein FQN57_000801 [Myotisia sp. PD_48]|nr:hypothetical protein FQN57_000801 [Myotisia sp. PD_48]